MRVTRLAGCAMSAGRTSKYSPMSDNTFDAAGEADEGALARRLSLRILVGVSRWVDPEDNPSGVVYGTIAVGALLAAESTLRDTFAETIGATLIALAMYWLAHAYSDLVGHRLEPDPAHSGNGAGPSLSKAAIGRAFVHELAIVKGATIPTVVLVICWVARVQLTTAVTAALWTSAAMLGYFEIVAALSARGRWYRIALESLIGISLGGGILLLHSVVRH